MANEYKGRNACTAWVNFDGTTTPPTIRDSYNVKAVIRTATGYFDIYFENPMYNSIYSVCGNFGGISSADGGALGYFNGQLNKVTIITANNADTAYVNKASNSIHIFGGKN